MILKPGFTVEFTTDDYSFGYRWPVAVTCQGILVIDYETYVAMLKERYHKGMRNCLPEFYECNRGRWGILNIDAKPKSQIHSWIPVKDFKVICSNRFRGLQIIGQTAHRPTLNRVFQFTDEEFSIFRIKEEQLKLL